MRTMILVLVMVSPPAVAAEQFDLICRHERGETRYRVDLDRGEACSGPCDRVWKMGAASSGELRLIDQVPRAIGDLDERATVNRVTGEYRYRVKSGSYTNAYAGTCAPGPFSGFPPPRFWGLHRLAA